MSRRSEVGRCSRGGLLAAAALCLSAASCGILPDELNLSPIYRHRIDPDGTLTELDLLWPLFYYDRDAQGGTDVRVRPVWRRIRDGAGEIEEHQFLVPLGRASSDGEESVIRLFPLFLFREHWEYGDPNAWDQDWWFTPFVWGGSSHDDTENYLAVFPVYGSVPDFLTYDRFSFFLFPLAMWTERGDTTAMHILWPLIGWGGAEDPKRPHWWRVLPFYGQSLYPGKQESYTALWPFFHWGRERLDKPHPYSSFFFFPIVGWKSGGAFRSWTFLWPFFRHAHKVEGEATAAESGDYVRWDFPWPILRYIEDTWSDKELHQWWITPLIASTRTKTQESLVLLYPLLWFRRLWDAKIDRTDTYILPLFWRNRVRYKKGGYLGKKEKLDDDDAFEDGEDFHWRLFPLADWREARDGDWRFRTLAIWPWDGELSRGIREAYDWTWTLAKHEGDAAGNSRVITFANVYSSRTFAGRRFQASVPFLFNFEADEQTGERTLRLLQFIPIRWGGSK